MFFHPGYPLEEICEQAKISLRRTLSRGFFVSFHSCQHDFSGYDVPPLFLVAPRANHVLAEEIRIRAVRAGTPVTAVCRTSRGIRQVTCRKIPDETAIFPAEAKQYPVKGSSGHKAITGQDGKGNSKHPVSD